MTAKRFFSILLSFVICFFIFGCDNSQTNDRLIVLERGKEHYINIQDFPSSIWTSDDETVAAVVDSGVGFLRILALSEGISVVKNNLNGKHKKEYRIQVIGGEAKDFEFSNGNLISINLTQNEYYQIQLNGVSIDELSDEFEFEIADTRLANVSGGGLIRARKTGVTKVFVRHKSSGLTKSANIVIIGDRSARYPRTLDTGGVGTPYHVQGFAADPYGDYFYYSFTDRLIKQNADGEIVGSVVGFPGHMGDACFNEADGRLYVSYMAMYEAGPTKLPSMEYLHSKNNYILIFDVEKITALNMAPSDDIVTCVYVGKPVVELATQNGYGPGGDLIQLGGKYGVTNGIDSVAFGPKFGEPDGKLYLTLGLAMPAAALSIDGFSTNKRKDNDYITIVQFDVSNWSIYEQPYSALPQADGPSKFDNIYFYYMGYHDYGIQNIEYDAYENVWFLTAYGLTNDPADEVQFPNYMFYVLDAEYAQEQTLIGNGGEKGLVLREKYGILHSGSGIRGYNLSYSVGIYAVGDGYYYTAANYNDPKDGQGARLTLQKWNITKENKEIATAPIIAVD